MDAFISFSYLALSYSLFKLSLSLSLISPKDFKIVLMINTGKPNVNANAITTTSEPIKKLGIAEPKMLNIIIVVTIPLIFPSNALYIPGLFFPTKLYQIRNATIKPIYYLALPDNL